MVGTVLAAWAIIKSKMNKRHLHHVWRYLRQLKPGYFVAALIVFGTISLISLRHNNEQMIRLRDAVYAADKNNGNVEGALRNLRAYVYGHMNTSLATGPNAVHPPIQLKYTYERLQEQQQAATGQGSALYTQAQAACENQTDTGSEVISCIQQYIVAHGGQLAVVPDGLYKFDFVSAKWSWDLAGWSLFFTILSAIGFLLSAPYHWWAKRYL